MMHSILALYTQIFFHISWNTIKHLERQIMSRNADCSASHKHSCMGNCLFCVTFQVPTESFPVPLLDSVIFKSDIMKLDYDLPFLVIEGSQMKLFECSLIFLRWNMVFCLLDFYRCLYDTWILRQGLLWAFWLCQLLCFPTGRLLALQSTWQSCQALTGLHGKEPVIENINPFPQMSYFSLGE